jgi:DsbC/DsbD-like thiol-disulfide interchange protein
MQHPFRPLALAAALTLGAHATAAQSVSDILSAELLPGWTTERGTRMAAIRLTLSQGWKTYWRSPGDAGIPPVFDWSGSDNIRAVHLHWPTPEVFDFGGMQTIGYARELVLPVEIWPHQPDLPVRLETAVDLGVCREVCVPATVSLGANLLAPAGTRDPAIRAALRARPATAAEAGVRAHSCTVEASADGLRLHAAIDMPALGPDEVVVIETADPGVWVAESSVQRDGRRLTAQTDLVAHDRRPFALNRQGVTISVLGGGRAVELSGCPAP